jgi:phenylalanyl-tRNA synthetase beta chain
LKVTINWLKEFLKTDYINANDIAELLTMSGTEVKKVENIGGRYGHIVIGQIIEFNQHPDADKLTVCKVNVGKAGDILNIVCGAKNFKKGDKVVVALEGAKTVQGITIRNSKLRGVMSEGMMCSEAELGLSSESEGIMILDDTYKVGMEFAPSAGLDDTVLELEITPNRPDCLNIMGIAREISAVAKIGFITPEYKWTNELNIDKNFDILIEDDILCPRYSAKIFSNVPKKQSPGWLKNRLVLCDYRPIDLIVDLTNYVMHEVGQPLHAFDKDLLFSNKIIIRTAKKGETIRTIDDNNRNLEEGMLLITDEKKSVAIAGIMGGKDTEINASTKNILLESANFSGSSIMRTSGFLGLRSEASNRFEKKIDPELTVFAIKRFEDLLVKIAGHKPDAGIYDSYKKIKRERRINLRLEKVENILGKRLDFNDISDILTRLGIQNNLNNTDKSIVEASVPSSRYEDLEREIDLIEEIARIYGFENFEAEPPRTYTRKGKYSFYQKNIKNLRQFLSDIGLYEVINYSFISEEWIKKLKLDLEDSYMDAVRILNPINEDFALLKTTPLPLLVKDVINNINHGIKDTGIFEITRVFSKNDSSKLPIETNILGIMLTGKAFAKAWNREDMNYGFYDLKGILECIFNKFYGSISRLAIQEKEYKFFHPTISADILLKGMNISSNVNNNGGSNTNKDDSAVKSINFNGDNTKNISMVSNIKNNSNNIGIIGKIHPAILDILDLTQDIHYLELNLDKFVQNIKNSKGFASIPAFPSIDIDLALVVDEDIKNVEIENVIKKSGTNVLKDIKLFDIYRGKQIEEGKKSMAYSLVFRDETRTLKDVEVEIIVKRILEELNKKFRAKLRE